MNISISPSPGSYPYPTHHDTQENSLPSAVGTVFNGAVEVNLSNNSSISLTQSLSRSIHKETDEKSFLARMDSSFRAIFNEKGKLAGNLVISGLTMAQISALALSYFCLEGSVRSIMDVMEDQRPLVRIRYLGDAGGWSSFALFSSLAMKELYEKLVAEGEYIRLKDLCENWIKDNKDAIESNPQFLDSLYQKIIDLLEDFNSRCLLSKSLVSRRIKALNILKTVESSERNTQVQVYEDPKVERALLNIQSELNGGTFFKQQVNRFLVGFKKVEQRKGTDHKIALAVFGIIFPMLLLSNAILSIVGEIGLGVELFYLKEELTDIGHFGEWPNNALQAFGAAIFLLILYFSREGDFEITRNVYSKHLSELQEEPALYKRLGDIANADLRELSAKSNSLNLSLDYGL